MKKLICILLCLVITQAAFAQEKSQLKTKRKEPGTAAVLSLLLPTAGHAYAGDWPRGLRFFAGRLGLGVLMVAAGTEKHTETNRIDLGGGGYYQVTTTTREPNSFFYVGLAGLGALTIWEAVDAAMTAKKYNTKLQQQNGLRVGWKLAPNGMPQIGLSYAF